MKCKKSRLLALCISLVLVLAGCTASGQSITPTYPRIEYRNSTYNFDPYNREIPIPEGADCPACADYCPVANYPGVCKYEERGDFDAQES